MKSTFLRLFAASWFLSATASAGVLINEININPIGGGDSKWQYLEILTTNAAGQPERQTLGNISVLFLDSNGASVGGVEEALNLSGLSTGANGLLLIGVGYDKSVPWEIPAATARADFAALAGVGGSGSIGPKSGLTVLIVEDFTGKPGDDLDEANGGTIGRDDLIGTILDSVGYGDIPYETRLQVDFPPDNLSRVGGQTRRNSTQPWIGGEFRDTDGPLSVTFSETFGDFTGTATPGAPNPAPPSQNPIRINEVLINPPGSDGNVEFIELLSTTEGIATTNNLWILIVESNALAEEGGNARGEVLEAWDLNGQATGTNGLLVLGNNYRRSANPWKDIMSKSTSLFDPQNGPNSSNMGDGDIGQVGQPDASNNALSILLVRDFVGAVKTDLAPGTDLDSDDDGLIDERPWDTAVGTDGILDSVGFDHVNDTILDTLLWPTYAIADVTQSGNLNLAEPDSLVRRPDNLAPNDASAWMGGDIGGESTTGIAYRPADSFGEFVTQVSPGQPNPGSAPEQDLILFNEVHLNPPGEDFNREYIEFLSPTRTFTAFQNLTLLMVDIEGINKGAITNVVPLSGLSTGGNGLLLMGDSYNDFDVFQNIPPAVHRADPPGLNAGEIGPNGGVALLLVEGFRGQKTDDLDTDDDGTFDTVFWDTIMDSVGFGVGLQEQANFANFNFVGFNPHSLGRIPGDFRQNTSAAWFGGTLTDAETTSLTYARTFGPYGGEATPGRYNLAAPRHVATPIRLNEINLNPPGNDDNYEYIELISPTGGRQSTNDLSLIVLENSGNRVGEILEVWNLDGMATGSNGILLLGNDYAPLIGESGIGSGYWDRSLFPERAPTTPFGAAINQQIAAVGDPLDLGNDNIGPNDSFTLILVAAFDGEVGDDVVSADASGTLDSELPWRTLGSTDGVIDGVGFLRYDAVVAPPAQPGFDGNTIVAANLSVLDDKLQTFQPDNISRRLGNLTPNDATAWFGGDIADDQPSGLAYGADFFGLQGAATPGTPNGETDPTPGVDSDRDGVSDAEEAIAGTDPLDRTDFFHVTAATRDAGGTTLSWASVSGKSYTIEYSTSLQPGSWEAIAPGVAADGAVTTFLDSDAGRLGTPGGYYRVQVSVE